MRANCNGRALQLIEQHRKDWFSYLNRCSGIPWKNVAQAAWHIVLNVRQVGKAKPHDLKRSERKEGMFRTTLPLGQDVYTKWHPFWDVDILASQSSNKSESGRKSDRTYSRYPVRSLRYWFMYHLICKEHHDKQRPLAVCEIGIGDGPLFAFTKNAEAGKGRSLRQSVSTWDGVSRRMDLGQLHTLGYSRCVEKNIEEPDFMLPQQYDVLILLHILEHLYEPEQTVARLLPFLRTGGVVIGGCPSTPHVLRFSRERRLRKTAEPFGHVSAFSSRRIKQQAAQHGLTIELLTAAYLFRMTGAFVENYRFWLRFNLLFGSVCPFWPGEIYWAMRKESKDETAGIRLADS